MTPATNRATVASTGGTLTITGLGGAGTGNSDGVRADKAVINSAGDYTVIGTAFDNANTKGAGNQGISYTEVQSTITAGNVLMVGTAPGAAANAVTTDNHGIEIINNSFVSNTGVGGTVTLSGTGAAAATGDRNNGVYVGNHINFFTALVTDAGTANKSSITSTSGNMFITGTGGGTGAGSSFNHGVAIANGTIDTASGTLRITGLGGQGFNNNAGVSVAGPAGRVNGGGATLDISGTARGTSGDNVGVFLYRGGQVLADATTANVLTVSGQGSAAATGSFNAGVFLNMPDANVTAIFSDVGQINVTGNGGSTGATSGSNNAGVWLNGNSNANRATIGILGGSIAGSSVVITGNGGGDTSGTNRGVDVNFGNVINLGTDAAANIQITGFADATAQGNLTSNNAGVFMSNAIVQDTAGSITISGTGAGTGGSNTGVSLLDTKVINNSTANASNITVRGIGSVARHRHSEPWCVARYLHRHIGWRHWRAASDRHGRRWRKLQRCPY